MQTKPSRSLSKKSNTRGTLSRRRPAKIEDYFANSFLRSAAVMRRAGFSSWVLSQLMTGGVNGNWPLLTISVIRTSRRRRSLALRIPLR